MRGKILSERSASAEFVTWCDHPNTHLQICAYPSMNFIVFVIARVQVLVVNLTDIYSSYYNYMEKKNFFFFLSICHIII